MEAIRQEKVEIPEVRALSKEARDLLLSLLEKDCEKRVTVDALVGNSWLMQ
jgi:hypothetical protein